MRDSISAAAYVYVYKQVFESIYCEKRWRVWEWYLMVKNGQDRHVLSRSCQYVLSWMYSDGGRSKRQGARNKMIRDGSCVDNYNNYNYQHKKNNCCSMTSRHSFNQNEHVCSRIIVMLPSRVAYYIQRLCILVLQYAHTMRSSLLLFLLFFLCVDSNNATRSVIFAQGFPCAYDTGQLVRDLYTAYPDFIKTGSLTFLEVRHYFAQKSDIDIFIVQCVGDTTLTLMRKQHCNSCC